MTAMAWTPVLPDATPQGEVPALQGQSSRRPAKTALDPLRAFPSWTLYGRSTPDVGAKGRKRHLAVTRHGSTRATNSMGRMEKVRRGPRFRAQLASLVDSSDPSTPALASTPLNPPVKIGSARGSKPPATAPLRYRNRHR